MIIILDNTDAGSTLYHNGIIPDFRGMELDDRIRQQLDTNDWSTGDYQYSEEERTFYRNCVPPIPLWTWVIESEDEVKHLNGFYH